MAKAFSPVFTYPTEKTGFFTGEPAGAKLIKDIHEVEHSAYGGWWPSFFPTTIGLLVTGAKDGKPNVMTCGCMAVVNAYPFMIGLPVFAEGSSPRGEGARYSLELMHLNPEFTINIPYIDDDMVKKIRLCGSVSGRDGMDKMEKAGFTALPSRHISPPILKECPLNFECRLHSETPMGSHHWIVGKVEAVYMDETLEKGDVQYLWRSLPELIRPDQKPQ
jgi:flavin reductase (DIM6/NTAB) family NADH-FMN oxidoreductase RutF